MKSRALMLGSGAVVAVFGLVWLGVILDWRAANRVPDSADIALWLLALPVAILVLLASLRWLVVRRRRQAAAAAVAPQANAPAANATAAATDPTRAWKLPVWAVAVQLAAGNSPAALAEATRAGQRVDLHPRFKDAQGMPVFAAEVDGIDLPALRATLPEAAHAWSDAQVRTVGLALTVATRVLDEQFDTLRAAAQPATATRNPAHAPVLALEWLLPARWSQDERETARQWLAVALAEAGFPTPELPLSVTPVAGAPATLQRIDECICAAHGAAPTRPHLLLASDSYSDAATIAEWDAAHRLHSGTQPEGRVPGEGASAILFGAAATAPATGAADPAQGGNGPAPLAQIHRPVAAERARPVDRSTRLDSATLTTLADQVLAQANLARAAVACLAGDADARSSRTAEAMHFAGQLQTDDTPADALLPLGTANGDCGAALALAAVAVAVQLSAESQHASLVFSNHDAALRAVLLVTPPGAAPTNAVPNLA